MIFFAILAVPLAAWTVRTCIAYDGFVFINTRTLDLRKGDNLENRFKAQHVRKAFRFEKITSCPQIEYLPPSRRYPSEEERLLIKLGLNPKKRIPAELKAIRRDAYPATTFWGRKWFFFKEFWRPVRLRGAYRPCPDCRFNAWSLRHNLLCIGFYGVLLPFMLIGVFKLARERNRALLFLLFPLIIQNLLHVLQWALTRYRNPVDAFIIILSGYGVYAVWEFCRGKDTQKVTNPL